MLGTVTVGLFYRQLVSRVRTTAGQESRGRGLRQTGVNKPGWAYSAENVKIVVV